MHGRIIMSRGSSSSSSSNRLRQVRVQEMLRRVAISRQCAGGRRAERTDKRQQR